MKKTLKWILIIAFVVGGSALFLKEPLMEMVGDMMTNDMFRNGDDDSFTASLDIGDAMPAIKASYKGDVVEDMNQFSGENGYVVIINRSVDWCPFCKKQAVNVNEHVSEFEKNGLKVVMITYDDPKLQQQFADEFSIQYPIISDIDAESMKALEVLHSDYPKGNDNYGLPYPGTLVVSKEGEVVGKLFLKRYENRVDANNILIYSLDRLGLLDQ